MYPFNSTGRYGGYARRNPIQDLLSTRTPQVSTGGLVAGANSMLKSGMNAFQKVADDIDQVKTNRAVSQLLSTIDMSDPYSGQQSAISGLLGIRGVDPKEAITVGTGIASPYIDKMKQDDLQDYRSKSLDIAEMRANKTTPKGYGMVTDEYGTTYVYNKDTGGYQALQSHGDNLGVSPKNVVLKSITNKDANGVETTVQVPFNKLTGQPIYGTKVGGISTDDGGKKVTSNLHGATATGPMGSGVSVKYPDRLNKTIQLPTGETVYVDTQGNPITNASGQYLVKTRGTENIKRETAKEDIKNTLGQLDTILERIKADPSSVGSIGSDFGNWIGNQVNDYLKVPTDTRLNRNQVEATGGVIAAGLRKGVESGVMTDKDFDRYMKLVPDVNDSPQEATYKAQMLMNQLSSQFGVIPPGYKKQYNTETGEYRIIKAK